MLESGGEQQGTAPWDREQLWELRTQSCLRKSQAELRSVSKATCLFLGEKDNCRRMGPQPCAPSPPHLPGSGGWGAIPAPSGVLTSVLTTTTKRNLRVPESLAAISSLLPLDFKHQNQMAIPVRSWTWEGPHCSPGWSQHNSQTGQSRVRARQRAPNKQSQTQQSKRRSSG